jgi:hypothetical protein
LGWRHRLHLLSEQTIITRDLRFPNRDCRLLSCVDVSIRELRIRASHPDSIEKLRAMVCSEVRRTLKRSNDSVSCPALFIGVERSEREQTNNAVWD